MRLAISREEGRFISFVITEQTAGRKNLVREGEGDFLVREEKQA